MPLSLVWEHFRLALRHQAQGCLYLRTVQYNTIQYSTIQYSTVQYNTVQHRHVFDGRIITTVAGIFDNLLYSTSERDWWGRRRLDRYLHDWLSILRRFVFRILENSGIKKPLFSDYQVRTVQCTRDRDASQIWIEGRAVDLRWSRNIPTTVIL